MDREMRRQYTVLVDFLGHILGPDYEVALHELKDDSNEIIAIANGELTGRHLGSPLSNKMLEYLTSHLYETQDYVLRFESTAITGKKLCSNSLFIKGPRNELTGLLCINFDSSRYQELSARVMDLCSNMLTPGVQSGARLIALTALNEHSVPDYDRATAQTLADLGAHVGAMTPERLADFMAGIMQK